MRMDSVIFISGLIGGLVGFLVIKGAKLLFGWKDVSGESSISNRLIAMMKSGLLSGGMAIGIFAALCWADKGLGFTLTSAMYQGVLAGGAGMLLGIPFGKTLGEFIGIGFGSGSGVVIASLVYWVSYIGV